MDINSFILGLTMGKNAASGDSGDGTTEWLYRTGSFTPTSWRHTVTHNFGKMPDIIMISIGIGGAMEPDESLTINENAFGMNGFIISEALVGKNDSYGSTMIYNPVSNGVIVGSYSSGIEEIGGDFLIAYADAQTITFGGRTLGKLIATGRYTYTWAAYARK